MSTFDNNARVLLDAPAKINLYLEIFGPKSAHDAFHKIATVYQTIGLKDRVSITSTGHLHVARECRETGDGHSAGRETVFSLTCDNPLVPTDSRNLAIRAAELLAREYPEAHQRHGGLRINLEKSIPVAAGLAGGSTDAAAVLAGTNRLWELGLSLEELEELGGRLGSDVPFCLLGGTVAAFSGEETLERTFHVLPSLTEPWAVLAKHRSASVSTPWAYAAYRERFNKDYLPPERYEARRSEFLSSESVRAFAHAQKVGLTAGSLSELLLRNDLEKPVFDALPKVSELKQKLKQDKEVIGCAMSGSGPTVFALTENKASAERIARRLQQRQQELCEDANDLEVLTASFCSSGVTFVAQK